MQVHTSFEVVVQFCGPSGVKYSFSVLGLVNLHSSGSGVSADSSITKI